METKDKLFRIEEGFWLSGKDHFLAHVDEKAILAFPQAGEMHGIHPREDVAETATLTNRWRNLKMTSRYLLMPADDVAIVSYRADVSRNDGEPYSALVSSAYIRRSTGWKLTFHQHSPV
ncbi:hypothetical protein QFZ34_000588 [Phyllobacterium ifriqiyense]|uniref:DUF4440 domain-containing protein n=1 Tax=Phyllobacterium ifriqiyense TaxID=314238 RepID=A0ABU0S457_9HYPH|nr:hypothetical protein [Phyllobacterium ifriqiyense]MDQ0995411.1 hypothetical protein [Phyllobacterium ifriqiyense]